tara:strand:- start:38 stop:346 length:309 start_codon:yes stop_codon:yes gene_type:complete
MANDINIINAIVAINPDAQATVEDNDYNKIIWTTGTTPISKSDLQAKVAELQTEYDNNKYQRDRKAEYPTIEELVVALYDTDDKADIETKRAAVKAKYPKPA